MIKICELEIYSVPELSQLLSLHPVTIRNYIRGGRIRAQKVGRSWRISSDNLKEFLNGSSEFLMSSYINKREKLFSRLT
jgi:excisionase family DNA binding protein